MAYYMYINKVLFPITPGEIELKIKNQNKTINLINEGEVNLIKSPGLTEIKINELLLPMLQQYPFANYIKLLDENGNRIAGSDKYHGADYYLKKLEAWKVKGKTVKFIISRTTPNGVNLLWDTNFTVTIEDYTIKQDAGKYGADVVVQLTMKEYRAWGAKKFKLKSKKNSEKKEATKVKTRKNTKKPAKTYIVKQGDTLYAIAKKQLDDETKWKKIYKLNEKIIESTAKKNGRKSSSNGYLIYPGTKLTLPS